MGGTRSNRWGLLCRVLSTAVAIAVAVGVIDVGPVGAALQPITGTVSFAGPDPTGACVIAAGPSGVTTTQAGSDGGFTITPPDPQVYLYVAANFASGGVPCTGPLPAVQPVLPELYKDVLVDVGAYNSSDPWSYGAAAGGTLVDEGSAFDLCIAATPAVGCEPPVVQVGGRITRSGGVPVDGACVFVADLGVAVADSAGDWSLTLDSEPADLVWPIVALPPFDTGAGPCNPASGWPSEPDPGSLVPEVFPNGAVTVSAVSSALEGHTGWDYPWILGVAPGEDRVDICLQTEPVGVLPRPDCLPRHRMAGKVTASVDRAPPQPYRGACAIVVGRHGLLGVAFSGIDGTWVMPDVPTDRDYVVGASAKQPDGRPCLESEDGPARVGELGLRIEFFDNIAFPVTDLDPDLDIVDNFLALGATRLTSSRSDLDICLSNLPAAQTTPTCTSPPATGGPPPTPAAPSFTPARAVTDVLIWPFRPRRHRQVRAGDVFAYQLVDAQGGVTTAFVVIDDLIVRGFRRFRIDVGANDIAAAGLPPRVVLGPRRGRVVPLWDGSLLYIRSTSRR